MTSLRSNRGFALSEFLVASVITLAVIGIAVQTFDDALKINDATLKLTDAGQNMRSGVNLLVRDLLQAGRDIPTGGIAIPSGSGATLVQRPSPSGWSYAFDNTTLTTLGAVTTGNNLGATVAGRQTDMITILMGDPFLATLPKVIPNSASGAWPKLSSDGSSMTIGNAGAWFAGDLANGVAPIKQGDLLLFRSQLGNAMQVVTAANSSQVTFGSGDPFNLNQRSAANGNITDLLGTEMSVQRVLMITYFVQETTPGEPRLMRALNMNTAQALAGVVEDLQLTYDLVDGSTNPTNVLDVPYTVSGNTFTSSQIRKVNLRVGVRSEEKSRSTGDYMRHYVTTVASLRNLAYVAEYK
jgi:Tfp pilus assembly protein PilW